MQETQSVEETRIVAVPNLVRSRFLLVLGWALLILSVALLTVHVIWMWKRMGTGAPLVGKPGSPAELEQFQDWLTQMKKP